MFLTITLIILDRNLQTLASMFPH